MTNLPWDIILQPILARYEDFPLLSQLGLVCSSWLHATRRALFRKVVVKRDLDGFFVCLRNSHKLRPLGPYIEELQLEGEYEGHPDIADSGQVWDKQVLDPEDLAQALHLLPNLHTLAITKLRIPPSPIETSEELYDYSSERELPPGASMLRSLAPQDNLRVTAPTYIPQTSSTTCPASTARSSRTARPNIEFLSIDAMYKHEDSQPYDLLRVITLFERINRLDLNVRHSAAALWPRSAHGTHAKPTAVGVLHLRALIDKWKVPLDVFLRPGKIEV